MENDKSISREGRRLLYRGMRPDRRGSAYPARGNTGAYLGARREIDIKVDPDDTVKPRTGGMSMVVDELRELPSHRRPESLGGEADDHSIYVYCIDETDVPACLGVRQDRPAVAPFHRVMEPTRECAFTEYLADLHATQPLWRLVG